MGGGVLLLISSLEQEPPISTQGPTFATRSAVLAHRQVKSVAAQPMSEAACWKQFRAHWGSSATRPATLVAVVVGADVVGVVSVTTVWAAARPRRPRETESVLNCIVAVAFLFGGGMFGGWLSALDNV